MKYFLKKHILTEFDIRQLWRVTVIGVDADETNREGYTNEHFIVAR